MNYSVANTAQLTVNVPPIIRFQTIQFCGDEVDILVDLTRVRPANHAALLLLAARIHNLPVSRAPAPSKPALLDRLFAWLR